MTILQRSGKAKNKHCYTLFSVSIMYDHSVAVTFYFAPISCNLVTMLNVLENI